MAITLYETLGVAPDADRQAIAKAYCRIMADNHPDRHADLDPAERAIAEEIAKTAGAAYQVLSNSQKRAAYDATLAAGAGRPTADERRPSPAGSRRTAHVDTSPVHDPFDIAPENWPWFTPPAPPAQRTASSAGRGRRIAKATVRVAAWLGWAGVMMIAMRGPLAASGSVHDGLTWSLTGPVLHLAITMMVLSGWLWRRSGFVTLLVMMGLSVLVVLADGGAHVTGSAWWFAMIAPPVAMLGSVLTAWAGLGALLGKRDPQSRIIQDNAFITVGSSNLGRRPHALDRLVSALHTAFGSRAGVRVMLLPDRVSVPQIKTQAVIVIGTDVHLLAIPPLGADGFEIAGHEIITAGRILRNVVLDEVAAVKSGMGSVRGARVFGYIVPTGLSGFEAQEIGPITYASLDEAISLIGRRSAKSLDRGSPAARAAAYRSMSRILAPTETQQAPRTSRTAH